MQKVICQVCEHKCTKPKLRENKINKDLKELYIMCPSCKTKTTIALVDKEVESLQKKIALAKADKDVAKALELQIELKRKMDKLNNR